jgi:hypothetical protein
MSVPARARIRAVVAASLIAACADERVRIVPDDLAIASAPSSDPSVELPHNLGMRVQMTGLIRAVHAPNIVEIQGPCCDDGPMLVLADASLRLGEADLQVGAPIIVDGVVRWMGGGTLEAMLGYDVPALVHARFDRTGVLVAYDLRDASGRSLAVTHRRRPAASPHDDEILVATASSPKGSHATAVDLAGAAPLASPTSLPPWPPDADDRRRPRRLRFDLTLSAGVGVDAFLGSGLREVTSPATAVDLRLLIARGRWGVELGFLGTRASIESATPGEDATLFGTTGEVLGRLELRPDARWRPYLVAGAAYRRFTVRGTARPSSTPDADDLLAVPVGAGVAMSIGHMDADLRATFRPAIDRGEVASRTTLGATARMAWRF